MKTRVHILLLMTLFLFSLNAKREGIETTRDRTLVWELNFRKPHIHKAIVGTWRKKAGNTKENWMREAVLPAKISIGNSLYWKKVPRKNPRMDKAVLV
jgi:hypothetical protein